MQNSILEPLGCWIFLQAGARESLDENKTVAVYINKRMFDT